MNTSHILELLRLVAEGGASPESALERLRSLPFEDLGFAKVDHHRHLRMGYPETIFCEGKTPGQIVTIANRMREHGSNVLGTRCRPEAMEAVLAGCPGAVCHEAARAFTVTVAPHPPLDGYVGVVCAGTSDIPVAEEAVVTCEAMGCRVERIYDVGVAGIHRLLGQRERLEAASAIIVCAGMEGALPSVIAGLVAAPVIGVPTSVGYGAGFGGFAALLGMLNSCATGLTVVNIDNGFGAAVAAAMINRIAHGAHREPKA
jgi:NCAIR mutase (PurE)-related protein